MNGIAREMDKIKLSPSIVCMDVLNLQKEIQRFQKNGADRFHFDIMDGDFVPRIGLSEVALSQILDISNIPVDVHLMMNKPSREIIEYLCELGPSSIFLHAEACQDVLRMAKLVQKRNRKAGIALNPATPVNSIKYIIEEIDKVLVMCYSPGTTDQSFISNVKEKIKKLRLLANEKSLKDFPIAVDGDINKNTIPGVLNAGANVLGLGSSALFKEGDDPIDALKQIKALSEEEVQRIHQEDPE